MLVNFEAFGNVQYSIIPEIMSSKNAHVVEQVVVEFAAAPSGQLRTREIKYRKLHELNNDYFDF